MNEILIFTYAGLLGWAGAYWGRYRAPIKRNSKMDRVLGAINVCCNAVLFVIAAMLPFATDFAGIPALGFAAAASFLSSLFLYQVRSADWRTRFFSKSSRRGRLPEEQKKTRWLHTVAYSLGHFFMVAYVMTLFGHL
ncbi:hypothetical protein [Paeniglutamicibacter sp.]|uniref:hypothetical protein n=1 Tax=Paeniglutamicibacter sp. TaxID=1934391 RepID=UPI00398A24D7